MKRVLVIKIALVIVIISFMGCFKSDAQTEVVEKATRARETEELAKWKKSLPEGYFAIPAFKFVKDDPALPRVLLIGDSISINYTESVRNQLAGVANVHRIPANGGESGWGLVCLEQWLGDKHWDVVYFNFGIHDLKSVQVGETEIFKQVAPTEKYAENLNKIVARLRQTNAVLIWASTTPYKPTLTWPSLRFKAGDDIIYNETAAKVMKEAGVRIDDLHAIIEPRKDQMLDPDNVHFTPKGSELLAQQVAKVIRQSLPAKSK